MFTYELATDYNYPNINIYRRYYNGEFNGWKAETADGYVMYNPNANNTELDPETGLERPVIYYYTGTDLPLRYNIDNFPYVAVLRSSVDENYIFGGGNNNKPEIM